MSDPNPPRGSELRLLELRACTVDLVTGELSGGRGGRLTERERALLAYLAARPGEVVLRSELSEQVFGYRPTVQTRAVDKAMYTLRRKVELDRSAPDHLMSRYGTGYLFQPHVPGPVHREAPEEVAARDVPLAWTSFVGRARELAQLARDVAEHRLVTVVGPGGTGKTRLVQQLLAGGGPPGWTADQRSFCDLSEARTREGVAFALARTLGATLDGDPVDALTEALRRRGRCLVVLDNVEQIAALLAPMLGRWLATTGAHLLTTSRETLTLPGERLLALEPLPDGDAQRLYLDRAAASCPDAALSDADRAALPEIVRLLDGLPLAIELAAARSPVFSPSRLLERLSERFRLLRRRRGLVDRHSSLLATLDWSWDLLSDAERAAAAGLSIFEGGFTLAAAEAVLKTDPVEIVQQLWEKSWLRRQDPDRFGFLLTVHDYLSDKLEDPDPIARRHGTWCAQLDEADVDPRELDNLVAACRRALERGWPEIATRTLTVAWAVFERQGARRIWLDLARRVLGLPGLPSSDAATIALRAGKCARWLGHADEAATLARQGLALLEGPERGSRVESELHLLLARLHAMHGRTAEAQTSLQSALRCWRETGGPTDAGALHGLANAHVELGLYQEACPFYRRALAIARERSPGLTEAAIRHDFGVFEARSGRLDAGEEQLVEALAVFRRLGETAREATLLSNLADIQNCLGAPARARDNAQRALELLEELGSPAGWVLARIALGSALSELDDPDAARAHLEAALEQAQQAEDPINAAFALDTLGDLSCHLGDFDGACVAYRRALALLPNQDGLRAGPLVQLGAATVLDGRFDEAEEALGEALQALEERGDRGLIAEAHAWLAIVSWRTGRLREARDLLARAEASGPLPHARVRHALTRAYAVIAEGPRIVEPSG